MFDKNVNGTNDFSTKKITPLVFNFYFLTIPKVVVLNNTRISISVLAY